MPNFLGLFDVAGIDGYYFCAVVASLLGFIVVIGGAGGIGSCLQIDHAVVKLS